MHLQIQPLKELLRAKEHDIVVLQSHHTLLQNEYSSLKEECSRYRLHNGQLIKQLQVTEQLLQELKQEHQSCTERAYSSHSQLKIVQALQLQSAQFVKQLLEELSVLKQQFESTQFSNSMLTDQVSKLELDLKAMTKQCQQQRQLVLQERQKEETARKFNNQNLMKLKESQDLRQSQQNEKRKKLEAQVQQLVLQVKAKNEQLSAVRVERQRMEKREAQLKCTMRVEQKLNKTALTDEQINDRQKIRFLEKQVKNRCSLLEDKLQAIQQTTTKINVLEVGLREKEKEIERLDKELAQSNEDRLRLECENRELKSQVQVLSESAREEKEMRQDSDFRIEDILVQNYALKQMLMQHYSSDELSKLLQKFREAAGWREELPEMRWVTVQELIEKNRLLMKRLRHG